jgi:branched-chain amino acid transport system substrate-binding protein
VNAPGPVLLLLASALAAGGPAPYRDFREHATPYAGPGREAPEPPGAAEVRIGYFGPPDPAHPDDGDAWVAASLAVAEANREGGYRGRPFRLAPAWAPDPWRDGAAALARLSYREGAWAIVGGLDGAQAHLAAQVVAKARLPLVCTASGDRTANAANVPWVVSLLPGDPAQADAVVVAIADRPGGVALIATDDRDSRLAAAALRRAARASALALRAEHVVGGDREATGAVAARVAASGVGAVLVASPPRPAARLVRALRDAGFAGPIAGGAGLARRAFLAEAGAAGEGVVVPLLFDPDAPRAAAFRSAFAAVAGHEPDFVAAHTYDGVRLVVAAIRRAGLNRARIGDALRAPPDFQGVTGPIRWDGLGASPRRVAPGEVRSGRIVKFDKCGTGKGDRHALLRDASQSPFPVPPADFALETHDNPRPAP